jgi:hypothetical protein
MNDSNPQIWFNIDNIKWLFDRYDRWRSSIATRCSLVVSADALLLAGHTFLLDKIITQFTPHSNLILKSILAFLLGLGMVFLIFSIFQATTGIANIWKSSRKMFGINLPDRLFFHPSDVVTKYDSFHNFKETFSNLQNNLVEDAIWAEIWTLIQMHHYRYQQLRKSILFLVMSLPLFVCSIVIIILRFLIF